MTVYVKGSRVSHLALEHHVEDQRAKLGKTSHSCCARSPSTEDLGVFVGHPYLYSKHRIS